jgi:hypothetical protein
MNDTQSKMQQWIDQVVNGFSNSSAGSADALSRFKCTVTGAGSPKLAIDTSGGAKARGSNPDCIFLGKAIMVNDAQSSPNDKNNKIYAYTVIGRRTYISAAGTDPVGVDTLANAKPIAAVFDDNANPPAINLTEEYTIPNGVRVLSVKSVNSAGSGSTAHLAGIYNSLHSDTSTTDSGATSLQTVLYPIGNNINTQDWTTAWNIMHCISAQVVCSALGSALPNPATLMKSWQICFDSTRDNERALLTLISNNGVGVFTNLRMGIGDDVCTA